MLCNTRMGFSSLCCFWWKYFNEDSVGLNSSRCYAFNNGKSTISEGLRALPLEEFSQKSTKPFITGNIQETSSNADQALSAQALTGLLSDGKLRGIRPTSEEVIDDINCLSLSLDDKLLAMEYDEFDSPSPQSYFKRRLAKRFKKNRMSSVCSNSTESTISKSLCHVGPSIQIRFELILT